VLGNEGKIFPKQMNKDSYSKQRIFEKIIYRLD